MFRRACRAWDGDGGIIEGAAREIVKVEGGNSPALLLSGEETKRGGAESVGVPVAGKCGGNGDIEGRNRINRERRAGRFSFVYRGARGTEGKGARGAIGVVVGDGDIVGRVFSAPAWRQRLLGKAKPEGLVGSNGAVVDSCNGDIRGSDSGRQRPNVAVGRNASVA